MEVPRAMVHARIQRVGGGVLGSAPPLENHRAIDFLCNTGAEFLENHKATKSAFTVGPLSARQ